MDQFTLELAKVNDTIDQAVSALTALVEAPSNENLKNSFAAYTSSVTAIDGQAAVVRTKAEEMKTRGEQFFKEWQADSGTGLSQERQAQLNVSYGKIKEQMMSAKDAFAPFLASLKDIQSLLSLDLTTQGLQTAGPLVTKAKANAAEVKSRIGGVTQQVNEVSGMLARKPPS
jgi:hypothetical protein